jgi:hypothetical protein
MSGAGRMDLKVFLRFDAEGLRRLTQRPPTP